MTATHPYSKILTSSELDPIINRGKQYVDLCFNRAVSYLAKPSLPPAPESNSLEAAFVDYLNKKTEQTTVSRFHLSRILRREALSYPYGTKLYANAVASHPNTFGPLSRIDLASPKSVKVQLENQLFEDFEALAPDFRSSVVEYAQQTKAASSPQQLMLVNQRFLERHAAFPPKLAVPPKKPQQSRTPATKLQLNLVKVKCLDEVDFELWTDWFDDKIAMGGKAWDSAGSEINVSEFHVAHFNQGDEYTFGGTPRAFASFNLTKQGSWPRAFFAILCMAEKDIDNGFIECLQKVWDAVDETVIEALKIAIVVAIKAAASAASDSSSTNSSPDTSGLDPIVQGLLEATLGPVLEVVVGYAISALTDALKDDVFNPVDITPLILESQTSGFNGNGERVSSTYVTEISRYGARYKVWYNWVLSS